MAEGSGDEGSTEAARGVKSPAGRDAIKLARTLAWLLGGVALVVTSWGLYRHNNWYLASDQFAFLTIARDLREGQVFHDAAIFEIVAPLRHADNRYDALTQTFYLEGERLWSRYPPGFPLLLAGVGALGGETAEHALNPLLYLATLGALAWLLHRLVAPLDGVAAAGAAALVPWVVLLVPTSVHRWGITVARDLPAHLAAVLALIAALGGQVVLTGVALGVACDIRPDALLYGLPIAALFALRRVALRRQMLGALAFALAIVPLLVWNLLTEGSIFAFGQAGEFRELFTALSSAAPVAAAQALPFVSGGAFQLAHLRQTLPVNAADLWRAFGLSLVFVLLALKASRTRRPFVLVALLPYPIAALFFYSCWSHADPRYLAGAALLLDAAVALGAVLVCAQPAAGVVERLFRVVVCVALVVGSWMQAGSASAVTLALGAAASAGTLFWALTGGSTGRVGSGDRTLAYLPDREWLRAVLAMLPALGLSGLALFRLASGSASYGPFPREQVEAAQLAVAEVMPPGSLVIAAEGLGRPVENLRFYSGLQAFHPSELGFFNVRPDVAALLFLARGGRAFFLMQDWDSRLPASNSEDVLLRVVARRSGPALLDWFIDPRAATQGLALRELVLTPRGRQRLEEYIVALSAKDAAGASRR